MSERDFCYWLRYVDPHTRHKEGEIMKVLVETKDKEGLEALRKIDDSGVLEK